ncbi:hypothetical protein RRG08_025638 [Elysia crispata]|uniref:Uncharacterized protein n=1 Tax=Elysia crispata TaxID=231223 RepID=A0AAE0YE59_9GAST|nr:hypothetical protein RRG08_025638 [Elysia crispata]
MNHHISKSHALDDPMPFLLVDAWKLPGHLYKAGYEKSFSEMKPTTPSTDGNIGGILLDIRSGSVQLAAD